MRSGSEWPGFEALPPSPPTEWPPGRPALPLVDQPPPLQSPRGSRTPWLIGAAVVAAAALLVGVLVARRGDDSRSDVAATTTTSTPPDSSTTTEPPTASSPSSTTTTAPPVRPAIDEAVLRAEVDELSRFVQRERGLAYQRPVQVEALSDTDFRARVEQDYGPQREADEARGAMLKALGVIPPDLDYAGQVHNMRVNFLAGFYTPEADALVVRLTEITPETRAVLVHELTHALDDQWFDLFRPLYALSPDEIDFGFRSLVEGNAMRVEHAYIDQLPSGERWNYRVDPLNDPTYAGVDDAIVDEFISPYELGEALVSQILGYGGQAELDAGFADPPTTSEQVRYPRKYLTREPRWPVGAPDVQGPVTDEGVMGLMMTEDMLAPVVGEEQARIAADGWGGDWYVAWIYNDLICFTTDYRMERAIDVEELHDAFTRWAAAGPHRLVEQPNADLVRVTACGPPPGAEGPSPT
jgi:hypothetical protein